MKVILAEKPSVARDIASVVGANTRKDGYYEGNDYVVTYAFGHLVSLAEPEDMNTAWGGSWRIGQLPMIPLEWKYKIVEKTEKQFKIIKSLFSNSKTSSIICATDAGREGEHIFRLIYNLSESDKPVERLWISSLTSDAIRDGLKKLKPSAEFDNLADAASARARADWIVGLNFTRAYTCINRQLCTIGRVQTPTLALIVDRQIAIDSFVTNEFYEIVVTFEPGFLARYITPGKEPQTRLKTEVEAKNIIAAIKPQSSGTVVSVETVEKRTNPQALYDLLTLQRDANKRFGYTAQETLDIAQSLYEEYKLISYPRTESRHISNDMVPELPRILSSVLKQSVTSQNAKDALAEEGIVPGKITASLLRPRLGKAYVDDAKLTDHHAIIPTHNDVPGSLPERQKNIYQLVALRFMSIFLPPEIRDETTAIIAIAEHNFRAKGFVVRDAGWTKVDPRGREADKPKGKSKAKDKGADGSDAEGEKKDRDDSEDQQQLPPLVKAQSVPKRKEELKKGKTSPPKPYDDGSLLRAMKNAGKELDDEDLASYMKQKGLGTPATRAAIIERLLKTGYVERKKKYLFPTEKGKALIKQVHSDLKDIALTASWEQRLADMQDGKLPLQRFESDIAEFIKRILPDVARSSALPGGERWTSSRPSPEAGAKVSSQNKSAAPSFGECPQCKEGEVRQTPKGAGCSRWREGCTFSVWRECYGKTLSDANMKELVKKRITKVITGFKKKDGSGTYDARLIINDEWKVRLSFTDMPRDENKDDKANPPRSKAGAVAARAKGEESARRKD